MSAAGSFSSRGAGRRRADRADGAGGVPGAAALCRVGAAQPRSDLEADDERRQRLGRRRPGAFGERQQRRNDRRDQLALHVGEVEVERMRRNPVRQRRQLRRQARSDWPTIEMPGSARPSARHQFQHDFCGSLRLPASITPTVLMNAVRARSTASAGACLRSKPAMKSTTRAWLAPPGGRSPSLPAARFHRPPRLRARRAGRAEQRHRARSEEQFAINVVALHRLLPVSSRFFGHRSNSKSV